MEDWDADLPPCDFATTHIPAERSIFISLELRDHPFDSLHSVFLSPFNFATHEMEDPFAAPQELEVQFGTEFGEGVAMKQESVKKSALSLNECKPFSE